MDTLPASPPQPCCFLTMEKHGDSPKFPAWSSVFQVFSPVWQLNLRYWVNLRGAYAYAVGDVVVCIHAFALWSLHCSAVMSETELIVLNLDLINLEQSVTFFSGTRQELRAESIHDCQSYENKKIWICLRQHCYCISNVSKLDTIATHYFLLFSLC